MFNLMSNFSGSLQDADLILLAPLSFNLRQDKLTLPSVTLGTHGEVDPMDARLITLV